MASRFSGTDMGGRRRSSAKTVEWLTPRAILDALGPFDLDPCSPIVQPFPTARRRFTMLDNGLIQAWLKDERVFLNPPYTPGVIGRWLARMAEHNHGTALIFARTETEAFFRHVWERASGLLFMRGRVNFLQPDGTPALREDGTPADAGVPNVLCAYGFRDLDVLAGCGIDGQFVPLQFPRGIVVAAIDATWHALLGDFLAQRGPVRLDDLYRAFEGHPKAKGNPTYQATIRRTLQEGAGRRVSRGEWAAAI